MRSHPSNRTPRTATRDRHRALADHMRWATIGATLAMAALLLPHGPAFGQDATPVGDLQAPSERTGEYADLDGARIFYEATGEGAPLVLLHGYPLSGALFSRMRDALEDRYSVVTLDHRGYGLSEAETNPGTIEQYASDALAVMDELGLDRAAIGGMSMGGPIVLEMYRQAPERFSAMILIDTIAAPASPMEAGIWRGTQERVEAEGVDGIVGFLMPQMLTGATRANEPAQVDYLTTVMEGASKDAALGGAEALETRPDLRPVLEGIEVPTLVLVGRADPVYSFEVSQGMVDAIGDNARIAIIEGASHAAVFERPAESAKAIGDFLASAGGSGAN